MEPKENNQSEEKPVVENPVIEPAKPAPAQKSFWSKILPWVIVAVVFFIGGLATIFFAVYQPAKIAAQKQITELTDQLSQADLDKAAAQSELETAKSELETVKAELTTVQFTISEQAVEMAKTNQLKVAYKFLVDVNGARAALKNLDTNTALQSINFAKADLAELEATELDPAALSGFSDRLIEASENISKPDLLKASEALDTLYSNLLNLVNNLP